MERQADPVGVQRGDGRQAPPPVSAMVRINRFILTIRNIAARAGGGGGGKYEK
jgi:hypothetical protein